MALSGKYEFVREENWEAHFKNMGLPQPPKADEPMEISINGDNVVLKTGNRTRNLVLNKTVEESFGEHKVQSTATLNGNTLTVDSKGSKNPVKRTYALSGSELLVTVSDVGSGSPDGKKYYKKV